MDYIRSCWEAHYPAVHCLMIGKTEDLCRIVLENRHTPEFKQIASM